MKKKCKKISKRILALFFVIIVSIQNSVNLYADVERIDDKHIIDGYEPNEPIAVHTPVISPTTIRDKDGHELPNGGSGKNYTQLVSENPNTDYQLILDNDYILHWDNTVHRTIMGYGESGDGDNPSKYDKYVQKKYVKFPFEVLYNGTFYELKYDDYNILDSEATEGHKYTQWIEIEKPADYTQIENNHWLNTPFYIPSYAREMGEQSNEGKIYYKVEAINTDGDIGEHFKETEDTKNIDFQLVLAPNGAKYVATYSSKVQLSGVIYDFSVVGTDNASTYLGESYIGKSEISFAELKKEKKSGTKNRTGGANVRYLLDGLLNSNWNTKNTIPLTDGKSYQHKNMGSVVKGQTFSYSFKTISNLWNDNGNYARIYIEPTYRYYDKNGNEYPSNKVKIYYHSDTNSKKYIEFGSDGDKSIDNYMTSYIGSPQLKGSYYTDEMSDSQKFHFGKWADFTVKEYNITNGSAITKENYLNKKVNSNCLSQISLNPKLRLYSGEFEELKWNIDKTYNAVDRYCDLDKDGNIDVGWGDLVDIIYLGDSDNIRNVNSEERFKMSIQTWYGQYHIPENIFVVTQDTLDNAGIHENIEDFDIVSYMNSMSGKPLGITETDPIFIQNGYLVLNFKIYTMRINETNHNVSLCYSGNASTGNMWKKEGYIIYPDADDKTSIPQYKYGDVIVIDMSRETEDKYAPAIHNIN